MLLLPIEARPAALLLCRPRIVLVVAVTVPVTFTGTKTGKGGGQGAFV